MHRVVRPRPIGLDVFAGRNRRNLANDRHELTPAAHLDAQHGKAILRVVERNALDDAGEGVSHRSLSGLLAPRWAGRERKVGANGVESVLERLEVLALPVGEKQVEVPNGIGGG